MVSAYEDATVRELLRLIGKTRQEWFPVLDSHGGIVGVVTYRDVAKAVDEGRLNKPVIQYTAKDLISVFPHESLREVMIRLKEGDLGHLPVVDATNPKRVLGVISRLHVVKAYNRPLAHRRPRSRRGL